jgi:hypothetical protein
MSGAAWSDGDWGGQSCGFLTSTACCMWCTRLRCVGWDEQSGAWWALHCLHIHDMVACLGSGHAAAADRTCSGPHSTCCFQRE